MRTILMIPLIAAVALAGCSKPAELNVTGAHVRLAASPKAPGVAYFTIHGGAVDDALLNVQSPVVIRVELHETMTKDGMASMKPLADGIPVPANSKIEFKEGGKHAMLFNINPGITPARTVPLIFTFTSGAKLQADASVSGPAG